MFGKAVSPGWDESQHSGGSLKPVITCPPGHYLGPQQKCLPYDPTYDVKVEQKAFNFWPLLLVGIAAYFQLK